MTKPGSTNLPTFFTCFSLACFCCRLQARFDHDQAWEHKLTDFFHLLRANLCQALHCLRTYSFLQLRTLRERLSERSLAQCFGTGLHSFHWRHSWRSMSGVQDWLGT